MTDNYCRLGIIESHRLRSSIPANARLAGELRGEADLILLKPINTDQARDFAKLMLQRWKSLKQYISSVYPALGNLAPKT